jgi:hypothetical protein
VLTAHANRPELAGLAAAAIVLLALGLAWPFPSLLPWPLVVLAGAYAWKLGDGGLLAIAELAYWSVELRGRARDTERLTERRLALIAALALLSVAAGGLVLAATSVRIGGGVAADLVGAAAAVVALAVVAALARPHG